MSLFDHPPLRGGTDSLKWAKYAGRDILPLWVADMDFAAPPAVLEALHGRVDQGVFGYAVTPPSLIEAVCTHLQDAFDWQIEADWLVWLPGLVTGLWPWNCWVNWGLPSGRQLPGQFLVTWQ